MEMLKKEKNSINIDFLKNITFKTVSYHKNFDLLVNNEQFITEQNGEISLVRIKERKPPFLIGEYSISVWNFELARKFGVELNDVLKDFFIEEAYIELNNVIENDLIDLSQANKLIVLHNFLIHPDYRKRGVTEEFIEFLYRNYYSKNNKIIALVKPIQTNSVDFDFYSNIKTLKINQLNIDDSPYELIPASKYYKLKELNDFDVEMSEYKLYSLAVKNGFNRIGETHLFDFNPEKIIKRITQKRKK